MRNIDDGLNSGKSGALDILRKRNINFSVYFKVECDDDTIYSSLNKNDFFLSEYDLDEYISRFVFNKYGIISAPEDITIFPHEIAAWKDEHSNSYDPTDGYYDDDDF